MKELISWLMVAIATIGIIYTIFLMVMYALLPKDDADLYSQPCDCERCSR